MAIIKDSGRSKRASISIKPLHQAQPSDAPPATPIHSQEPVLKHPEHSTQKKVVGLIKPIESEPVKPFEAAPTPQIDPAIVHEVSQMESQLKREAEQRIKQFEAAERQRIDQEIAQVRNQKLIALEYELQTLRDQAKADGLATGRKEGENLYAEKIREVLAMADEVSRNKQEFMSQSEPELLKLSLKIAEKLVQKQIELDPTTIHAVIRDAIRRITDKDKVIIKVNTADADYVRQHRDDILEKMTDIRSLEIHEDPRVDQGSCILETRLGFIDSSLSTKLQSIETALFKVYNDQ
ncbi:hypothetical protein EBR96_08650 [bacterium]|nr:hypothetical protein [bacterium]